MRKYLVLVGLLSAGLFTSGCQTGQVEEKAKKNDSVVKTDQYTSKEPISTPIGKKDLNSFLPAGFKIFEKVDGDFNKDGLKDCILIIKATDKSKFFKDEYRGLLDRNRRGLIALLNNGDGYVLAVKNYDCFSSENEDGGVYYAPELSLEIKNGNLFINYGHGRYGYWQYTFRFKDSDFELIGYDVSENSGPVIDNETSINFLTGKKISKENTNKNADGGDEVFNETVTRINKGKLFLLSKIRDFDEFEVTER